MNDKQKAYEAGQTAFWDNKPGIPHHYDFNLAAKFVSGFNDAKDQCEKELLENEIDIILDKLKLDRDEAETLIRYFTGDLQQ